jgi:hypothetical protein
MFLTFTKAQTLRALRFLRAESESCLHLTVCPGTKSVSYLHFVVCLAILSVAPVTWC